MDKRQELRKNDILDFPGLPCVIDKALGHGSNVIVYLGHYRDHQNPELTHRVLIPIFPCLDTRTVRITSSAIPF